MLIETMIAPGHRAIAATLTVTIAGFALFMFGTFRRLLRQGQPMSHAQIEENIGSSKYGTQHQSGLLRFRASTCRHFGPAVGAKAEQGVSIAAMKEAWRSGAWRRDPTWQTIFMMAAGCLMMTFGGFGAAVVAGSAGCEASLRRRPGLHHLPAGRRCPAGVTN